MDLVLVGLPGSGKSAVGRRLAQRYAAIFIDLDELIERRAGKAVPAIFAEEGESGFRKRERDAVLSLGPADASPELRRIIATGGGTVIDPRNRWFLYRDRFSVWLDGAPEVLAQRLSRSANVRPLIAGHDPSKALGELVEARRRFYAPALQISGTASVSAIVQTLEKHLADGPPPGVTVMCADTAIGRLEIGCGIAASSVASALVRLGARRAILLSEPKAWQAAGVAVAEALTAGGWPVEHILLPRGESAKRMQVVEETCRELARLHVDRKEPLVAIGGGALTDAAGFVAASYLRGVPIIQVPTTLVGQIDAAIGGKTAVDLPEGKNLVGAFHQPAAVVADISFLATLPVRQRLAALGEIIKMAVLGDERLLELIEEDGEAIARGESGPLESGTLAEMVERCAWAKVEIVTEDEREAGRRMTLNLGHTIGHGIEAAAGYSAILHGEAVAYGLRGAFAIATALGMAPADRADRVNALLDRLGLGVEQPEVMLEAVRGHIATDKKHALGRLNWVLPTDVGVAIRSDIPAEVVDLGLAAALRRTPIVRGFETSQS
jgi:shikimate kinase / 3-dehydroquinate synthase